MLLALVVSLRLTIPTVFKDQLDGHHQRYTSTLNFLFYARQLVFRYRTLRSAGAQEPAFEAILCPVLHRRHHASDAHSRREEETHSLESGFILVHTHPLPSFWEAQILC